MENCHIEHWLFFFFLFTIIGWVQESTIESVYHRRLINRGFLFGPYIPIYGIGGCLMLLVCMPFRFNGFLVFFVGMFSCTVLEYFTGWVMERVFKKQFWDYSMLKLTYKNRISLVSSLFWGVLSLFMVYILQGIVHQICFFFPNPAIVTFDVIMMCLMSVDAIITVKRQIDFSELVKKLSPEQIKQAFYEKRLEFGRRIFRHHFGHNNAVDIMEDCSDSDSQTAKANLSNDK